MLLNIICVVVTFQWIIFCTCLTQNGTSSQQVQFDKFVAQGSVLNNYANILELLLRLRQCCNHPFLVIRLAMHCETILYCCIPSLPCLIVLLNFQCAAVLILKSMLTLTS